MQNAPVTVISDHGIGRRSGGSLDDSPQYCPDVITVLGTLYVWASALPVVRGGARPDADASVVDRERHPYDWHPQVYGGCEFARKGKATRKTGIRQGCRWLLGLEAGSGDFTLAGATVRVKGDGEGSSFTVAEPRGGSLACHPRRHRKSRRRCRRGSPRSSGRPNSSRFGRGPLAGGRGCGRPCPGCR